LKESRQPSICIIENISTEYIEALDTKWGIDPKFFIEHATNPDKDELLGDGGDLTRKELAS
jgi:hypothetical protein